jgi:hypothetical protein
MRWSTTINWFPDGYFYNNQMVYDHLFIFHPAIVMANMKEAVRPS